MNSAVSIPRHESPRPRPRATPREAPKWSGRGPGLFAHLYLALAAQSGLLLYAVYGGREEDQYWMGALGIALGLLALLTAAARDLFHDWLLSMSLGGRVWLLLMVAAAFLTPYPFTGHRVVPEGFVFALVPLLPFAVTEAAARIYLGVTMVGFWFALPGRDGLGLPLTLGFGATTLWSFACAHFAFTGHPFGLRGWWPVRRILLNVALYFGPSALAAWLVHRIWPEAPERASPSSPSAPTVEEAARRISQFRGDDLSESLGRAILYLALIIASLVGLYFIRRYFSRRAKPLQIPQVRMTDVGNVELFDAEARLPGRRLSGNRGRIVALWWKWAREFDRGLARRPGETAAELASRLASTAEGKSPPGDLTRLMEVAHYGPHDPARADVEKMNDLVRSEIERGR